MIPVQRLPATGALRSSRTARARQEDVRLRFGAPLAAESIAAYVERIDFDVDSLFGVYGDALELGSVRRTSRSAPSWRRARHLGAARHAGAASARR